MNDQTFEYETMHLTDERHTTQNEMFYLTELNRIEHMNCTLKETTCHWELKEKDIDAENLKWIHWSNTCQQCHPDWEMTDKIDQKAMTMKIVNFMLLSSVVLTFWDCDTFFFLYDI